MESVFNLQILLHFFAFWFTQLFVKLYRVGQKLPLGDGPPALGQRTHSQSLECPKRNCSCTGCQPCDGKWLLCWLRWVLPPWSRCGWLMEFVDICRRYEIREIIVLVYIYTHIYTCTLGFLLPRVNQSFKWLFQGSLTWWPFTTSQNDDRWFTKCCVNLCKWNYKNK